MVDLEFQYFFIVDQLVYYATIKTGENWFQLAGLLFGFVYLYKSFFIYCQSHMHIITI